MSGPRRIGSKDHRGPVLDGAEIGERKRHEVPSSQRGGETGSPSSSEYRSSRGSARKSKLFPFSATRARRDAGRSPGTVSLHARPARRRWYLRVRLGRQHPGRRHHLNFGARVVAPAPSVVIARGVPVYFYGSGYYRPWGVGFPRRAFVPLRAQPRPALWSSPSYSTSRGEAVFRLHLVRRSASNLPVHVGPAVRQARILAALPERSFRPGCGAHDFDSNNIRVPSPLFHHDSHVITGSELRGLEQALGEAFLLGARRVCAARSCFSAPSPTVISQNLSPRGFSKPFHHP